MTLEVTIRAGNTGVQIIPVPIAHILERVEFLAGAGNVLVSRHEASQLCWPFRHMNESQLQLHQKTFNFWCGPASTEHGPQPAYPTKFYQLAAGEERTYYIPLLENPFATCRVFGAAIAADCFVRCWFKGPSSFFVADPAGSPPSLKSLNLIVSQDALSPSARNELAQRYASQSMDWRYFRPSYQSVRANLAPGQRYQWQMSAVLGVVSELIVSVLGDNTPAGVRTNFMQVASWELLDAGGANIIGGSAIKEDYQVYIKQSRKAQSRALFLMKLPPTNDNVLVLEFGDSRANFESGCLTGYYVFTGSEQLALTMPADLPAGSYEVRIEYLAACRMNISKGQVSVHPS
jgi:hypothetical protein